MSLHRGGKADAARMPSAPASLRVQLSPAELLAEAPAAPERLSVKDMLDRRRAVPAPAPAPATATAADADASNSAPPADAQELASSIMLHQQRRRRVLAAQEALILNRSVTTAALKQALTILGPAAYTQITHERHLSDLCGYPLCSRQPRLKEKSLRPSPVYKNGKVSRHEAPFRLSSRGVTKNSDDEEGGRNAFCSEGCWARSEWVKRWVLSDELRDPLLQQSRASSSSSSTLGVQPGRFERSWDHSEWMSIELLDDVHPDVVKRLDGDHPPPFVHRLAASASPSAPGSAPRSIPASAPGPTPAAAPQPVPKAASEPATDPAPVSALPDPTPALASETSASTASGATVHPPPVTPTAKEPRREKVSREMYTEQSPHPLNGILTRENASDTLSLVEGLKIQERPASKVPISTPKPKPKPNFPAGPEVGLPESAERTANVNPDPKPKPKLIYSRPSPGLDDLLGFSGLRRDIQTTVPLQSRMAAQASQASHVARASASRSSREAPRDEPQLPEPRRVESVDPSLAALLDSALHLRDQEVEGGRFDPEADLGKIRQEWALRRT